jgi:Rieske Fe-S protein
MHEQEPLEGCCADCLCQDGGCCADAPEDGRAGGTALSRRAALERLAGLGLGVCTVGLVAGCPTVQGPEPQGRSRFAPVNAGNSADPPQYDPFIWKDGDDAHSLTEDGFIRIAAVGDLPISMPVEFKLGDKRIYVSHLLDPEGKDFFIIYDRRCPHSGCTIGFALLKRPGEADTYEFRCPCHGSRFNIRGQRIAGPARRDLTRYAYDLRQSTALDPNDPQYEKKKVLCVNLNQTVPPEPAPPPAASAPAGRV